MTTRSPLIWYRSRRFTLWCAMGCFLFGAGAATSIVFGLMPPHTWETISFSDRLLAAVQIGGGILYNAVADLLSFINDVLIYILRKETGDPGFDTPVGSWIARLRGEDWIERLAKAHLDVSFYGRLVTILAASLAFAVPMAVWAWLLTPLRQDAEWVEGPRLVAGRKAARLARTALRDANKRGGHSIELAPGVPLPREREARSLLVLGAQRSGKTVFLRSLLRQLRATPAKLIVHDIKGDMTAAWPDDKFILLAPHDARSYGWDIGRDVTSELAAFELASALVPEGKDPTWAQGAQVILTGLIVFLQRHHGMQWSWRELRDTLELPPTAMRDTAGRHLPAAANLLAVDETGAFTRNATSYVNTLLGPTIRLIRPLAEAWGNVHPECRLSLTEWLADRNLDRRALILQGMPQYPELSKLWMTAAIRHMIAVTGGANFKDSKTRRIWFMLDEFPQLGRVPNLFKLPATHAAKGVCLAAALQTLSQVRETYGPDAVDSLTTMTGTKVIFRLEQGDSAIEVVSKWVGEWRFRFCEPVSEPGTGGKPRWRSEWRERKENLLLPSTLADLGPGRSGLEGLVLGLDGGAVYRLFWPFEHWPEQRPGSIPANWIMGYCEGQDAEIPNGPAQPSRPAVGIR